MSFETRTIFIESQSNGRKYGCFNGPEADPHSIFVTVTTLYNGITILDEFTFTAIGER